MLHESTWDVVQFVGVFKKLSILMELYKMFMLLFKLHLELCCCIVSDGGLMPDRSFMTLAMGA
jgi:hypothetical protein